MFIHPWTASLDCNGIGYRDSHTRHAPTPHNAHANSTHIRVPKVIDLWHQVRLCLQEKLRR